MTFSIAQLHFAAEFTVFLVALAGLALTTRSMVLAGRPTVRSLFVAGFLAEAAGAFLYGSLILARFDEPGLAALRLAGLALLAAGCVGWRAATPTRIVFLGGVVILLAAEATRLGLSEQWSAWLRVAGALLVGLALVLAARPSIPARIGTSAAALLLVVILAVSLALSVVINRNVVDGAFTRLDARARSYATGAAAQLADDLSLRARLVGAALSDPSDTTTPVLLQEATSQDPAEQGAGRRALTEKLVALGRPEVGVFDVNTQSVLLVGATNTPVASAGVPLSPGEQLELAGSQAATSVLGSTTKTTQAIQSVSIAGKQVFALAAYPVAVQPAAAGAGPPGRVALLVATRMDSGVLQKLLQGDVDTSVALVAPGLAQPAAVYTAPGSGAAPSAQLIAIAGRDLFSGRSFPHTTADGAFVVAQVLTNLDGSPIVADHVPVAAMVVSSPTASVDHTREDLFRTLFAVALGGALLALALAVTVGERLGSGLRRLADAAGRISTGDLEARTGLTSSDELGALSASFDSMAGSLATMTTDLRRAAEEEAALRARLQAVVAGMGDALLAVDPAQRITDFNRAAEELFGIRAEAAIGSPVDRVVRVVDGDSFDPVRASDAHRGERTVLNRDDDPIPVSVSVGQLQAADGSTAGAVVVLRDMRREHEVDDMKTQFLANISHELRTPLTPIKGYAGVLARRQVSHEQAAQFAGEISAGVDQLERVITQLVDFSSMAAGRLSLGVEPVTARALLREVALRWRPRLPATHSLTTRSARDAPDALVDSGYLQRCFDELIDNAVKYSPDGGRIAVAAQRGPSVGGDAAEPSARFTVTDQGIGLDPEEFERLLGDFSQADPSATRRFGGLGLGLTLVERIVRAHHGQFFCERAPNGGSRFVILLPGVGRKGDNTHTAHLP